VNLFIANPGTPPPTKSGTWLDRMLRRDPLRKWDDVGWLEDDDELTVAVDPAHDGAEFIVISECSVVAGSTVKSSRVVPRNLPPRAQIDVAVWQTKGEMAQRLDDVRIAVDREFQLGLLELEVATGTYTEHIALTLAGFCLARDDIPAALAVLRGWARNPRRLP